MEVESLAMIGFAGGESLVDAFVASRNDATVTECIMLILLIPGGKYYAC